jgi:hypothetical protein
MTFSIQQRVKRLSAKDQHRLFQMMQPPIDLRRFAHFTAQSLKFEELEKREKNPIRREYYHRLNILKQERAMMYMRRYYNRHYASIDLPKERQGCFKGGIGTPRPNTGEMVVTKEQAAKLAQVFDTRPTTHIGVISAADIKQQILQH